MRHLLAGLAAGAAGTVALNIITYADMAVRARPSSQVPARVAGALAERAGIDLAPGDGESTGEQAEHRREGLGALMGYATGLGMGAAYGLVRPLLGGVSLPAAGTTLGLAVMATSDLPAVGLGATDPATWGTAGWLADLVPHLVYGLVTALTFETFAEP